MHAWENHFDVYFYHFINQFAGHIRWLDGIMIFFASYSPETYAVLFLIAWFAVPRGNVHVRNRLLLAGIGGLFALGINAIVAQFWFRPRPFTVLPHGTYTQLVPHPADSSFPSDHAAGSFGFASGTWTRSALGPTRHVPTWIQLLFSIIAIFVLIARVFVGVHWPTDVIAGAIIGILAGRLLALFERQITPVTRLLMKLTGMSGM